MSAPRLGRRQRRVLEAIRLMTEQWGGAPISIATGRRALDTGCLCDEGEGPAFRFIPDREQYLIAERLAELGLVEIDEPAWEVRYLPHAPTPHTGG